MPGPSPGQVKIVPMKDAGLPVTLIVVGLGWLAWHFGWIPDRDWVIALGFVVAGVAVMAFDGLTRSSVVAGPLLIGVGVAWGLHERYGVRWNVLLPCLLVWLGVLMLLSRHPRFPERHMRDPRP
jgi:hypothetical protein